MKSVMEKLRNLTLPEQPDGNNVNVQTLSKIHSVGFREKGINTAK
ncbi:MAG: hypothetical protein ACHQXK_02320 [Methanosarcina thermophila]|jgi:hypothetical protein|nr:hypothetical protein [Methanosarcina flavescens]